MKLNRSGAAISLVAAGALVLSACGSNSNSSSSNTSPGGSPTTGAASASGVTCGGKKTLKASGSTAQKNAMDLFMNAFTQACPGQTLNYTANGSGAGIKEFTGKQTDFAGSDSPLNQQQAGDAQQRCGSPAWNLPVVFGPIAITYNAKGVDTLALDGPTAAKIFNGTIKTWDDPAIKQLNSNANLPSEPIVVVYRNDQSGTTDNFQQYLDAAGNGAWGKGAGKTFNGGVGEGAKGNDGTSAAVKSTEGAITYNEWSFAINQGLKTASIITPADPAPVAISPDSAAKTVAAAAFKGQGNDLVLDLTPFYKPTQPGAYPIILATYEIVCSKYPDSDTGPAVKAFLQSTIGPGQSDLGKYGYSPLPSQLQSKLATSVNAIQ